MFQRVQKLLNWPKWLTFSFIFLLFFFISITKLDPDFGWHLRSGQLFAEQGIPETDPFTYTAFDFPWIDHEPLNDILVYHLYSFGGYILLAFIFASLWTVSIFLISRKSNIPPPLLLLASLAVIQFAGIRTLTWSFLFLTLLICLIKSIKLKNLPRLLLLFLLFVLWANLHGSFLIGLVYLAYTGFYKFFTTPHPKRSFYFLIPILVATFATLINPYGFRVYIEISRTLLDTSLSGTITEWSPNIPLALYPYLMMFVFSVVATIKTWRLRDYLSIENCFFFAALLSQRHWPLFVLVSLPIVSSRLTTFLAPLLSQARTIIPLRRILSSCLIVITAFTVFSFAQIAPKTFDYTSDRPNAAISYLKNTPCPGNLFNEYNDGGYLIWKLPEYKVYIDGRMPSWKLNGVYYMQNWLKILDDPEFRESEFEKHNIECALVFSDRTDFIEDLENKNWHIVSETENHILLYKTLPLETP